MMTDAPLFSIVTITKDNLGGLKRTADSIAAQSFTGYEWLVADGNSTDGTGEFLPLLPARIVSRNDDGLYDAMNKGLSAARGDYILFLNAGDVLSDADILSTLARIAVSEKPDFIYGDALETGGLYKKAHARSAINWGMITHHQAMIYRREMLNGLVYDVSYKVAADYAFTRAFLKNCRTVHYIPAAICIFENGGLSEQNRRLGRREQFITRKKDGTGFSKNAAIYCGQTATAALREKAPSVYTTLRRFSSRRTAV